MRTRLAILWSLVYVETAAVAFAITVPGVFLFFNVLGELGALADGTDRPPVELTFHGRMCLVLLVSLTATSVPTAAVLGVCAARLRTHRLRSLLGAGAACLCVQAIAAAYPFAAVSPYFLSNTEPKPFPQSVLWDVPFSVVVAFAAMGLLGFPFLLGPAVATAIGLLERRTRPS